jgi:prepilin-type processing-associated H-X9-DG protein
LGAHDSHGWGEGDALPLYYYASSYGINVCVTGYYTWSPTTWRYLRISQIKKPSTNMELVESKHYWTVYYGIHYDLMRERHMNRMNTVFVDGHTAKIRKLEIGTGESGIPDDLFYKYWGIIRAY